MAVYATYTQYTNDYLGTAIAEADFDHLALVASASLDRLTFDRVAAVVLAGTETDTIALIVNATCSLAEEIQTQDGEGSIGAVKSERVGNLTVTYADGTTSTQAKRKSDAAALYLAGTGLMYRGFAAGEYGGTIADE